MMKRPRLLAKERPSWKAYKEVPVSSLEIRFLQKGSPVRKTMADNLSRAFGGRDAFDELSSYADRIRAAEASAASSSALRPIRRADALKRVAVAKEAYSRAVRMTLSLDNEISKHNFYQKPHKEKDGIPPKAVIHQVRRILLPPKILPVRMKEAQLRSRLAELDRAIREAGA